jgi:hypothetical protein
MFQLAGLLVFSALVAVGWIAALRAPELARKAARWQFALLAIGIALLSASGVQHGVEFIGPIHRWGGQLLTAGASLVIAFGAGVLLKLGQSRWARAVQIFATLLLQGAILLVAISGYLGPSHQDPQHPAYAETHNRFIVLHTILLPTISFMLAAELWWFMRRPSTHGPDSHGVPVATLATGRDNPYHSPRS